MSNPGPDPAELLAAAERIAVVGMSHQPGKAAHDIPAELIRRGFTVVPVNPTVDEVLGEPAYDSVADVPDGRFRLDIVNVFRPADEAPGIVRAAVDRGAGAVWLQLGIASDEARELALDAGLAYVEDTCIGTVARRADLRAA